MANIKQQIKRIKTNEAAHMRNVAYKSKIKTFIKKVELECENKNKKLASSLLNELYKLLDKAHSKGLYHANFVARNKSRLAKAVNSISK